MSAKFRNLNEHKRITEFFERELKMRSSWAIAKYGTFIIGVSGGSIAQYVIHGLHRILPQNLEKTRIFFCDERFVAANDKDSTYGVYKTGLIPSSTMKESQLIGININLTLKECAQDYEEKILKEFHSRDGEIPMFDMLFLGIGDDGHTCSLFPGHPALQETDHLVAPVDNSPKPPPQRITMTLPLINNASCLIFAALGKNKADIVKRIFVDKEKLPAGMIRPVYDYYCVLDAESAKYINC